MNPNTTKQLKSNTKVLCASFLHSLTQVVNNANLIRLLMEMSIPFLTVLDNVAVRILAQILLHLQESVYRLVFQK